MSTTREQLLEIYQTLLGFFGPQHWWPARRPLKLPSRHPDAEHKLDQLAKAIANLKAAGCLDATSSTSSTGRSRRAHPSRRLLPREGQRLRNFIDWLCDDYGGDLKNSKASALASAGGITQHLRHRSRDRRLDPALRPEPPGLRRDTYTARVMVRHA